MRLLKSLSIIIVFTSSQALSGVVFEDNFNAQPDWKNTCTVCGKNYDGYNGGADEDGVPTNWTYWRSDEAWNPNSASPTIGSQPELQITDNSAFGLTSGNKAFVIHNESRTGDAGWGSDGILTKILDSPISEMYLQVKIKMPSTFQWHWTAPSASGTVKVLRMAYYHNNSFPPSYSTSPYLAFHEGNLGPTYIMDITHKEAPYNFRIANSWRCGPVNNSWVKYGGLAYKAKLDHTSSGSILPTNTTYWNRESSYDGLTLPEWVSGTWYHNSNYFCSEDGSDSHYDTSSPVFYQGASTTSFANSFGDGNWHTVKMYMKMNSAPGVADGESKLWIDGNLSYSKTNYLFRTIDSPADMTGFNNVGLGGNAYNNYTGILNTVFAEGAEQWYAIDDVVVSTTDIPSDYVIGGGSVSYTGKHSTGNGKHSTGTMTIK